MSETPVSTPFATMGTTVTIAGTEILGIQSIGDPEGDDATIDVTTLKDTEQKNIPGLKQSNVIALTCYKDKSGASGNYEVARGFDDGADKAVVITFADGSSLSFNARVTTKLGGPQVNNAQMFTINLFKTGDSTYTAHS